MKSSLAVLTTLTTVTTCAALGLPGVALAQTTPAPTTPTPAQTTPTPTTTSPVVTIPATGTVPGGSATTTTITPVLTGTSATAAQLVPSVSQPSGKTPPTPLPNGKTKIDTSITGITTKSIFPQTLYDKQTPGQPLPGDPTEIITLDDAIATAFQRSPNVLQAQESAVRTRYQVDQIKAIEHPQISATAGYSRLANSSSGTISGGPTPSAISNPFSVGLTTSPPGTTPIALSSGTTSSGSSVNVSSGAATSSGSISSPTTAVSTSSGSSSAASSSAGGATRGEQVSRQTTGTGTGTGGSTNPGGGSSSTTTGQTISGGGTDLNQESARITISQLIDITGIVKTAEKYGDLQEALSRLELARIRQQTAYNVRNAYYNLLRAIAFENVDQAAVTDSAELLRVTTAQRNQGVASDYDVLTARTQLDTNTQALISARNQVALSKNAFALAIGLDPSTVVTPQPQPIPAMPDLDETNLLRTAFSQRPEYVETDVNLLKAGLNIRLSHRNLEPYLDAGITGGYNPSASFNGKKATASIGVALTVPLYDGGATRAAVNAAKSDQRVALIQKDQFVKGIKAEVQQSSIAVRDAAERISVVTATVAEAREALRLANVRFKAGVGTQLDVNNAEAQLVQSESNEVNAQFDYLGAVARLSLAVGNPQ